MAKQIICDRCNEQIVDGTNLDEVYSGLFPFHEEVQTPKISYMEDVMPSQRIARKNIDLCKRCVRSLVAWFEDMALIVKEKETHNG